jgi:hypothetical protein
MASAARRKEVADEIAYCRYSAAWRAALATQENAWHTGGGMFFGADRFLYLAIGDEGGSNDFYKTGQKINERLFAGILRIDVDQDLSRSHPVRLRSTPRRGRGCIAKAVWSSWLPCW